MTYTLVGRGMSVAAVLACATIAAGEGSGDRIGSVVAALNARATAPAIGEIGDDGAPWEAPSAAAWTVVGAGGRAGAPEGTCAINVAVLGAAVAAQVNDVVVSLMGDARIVSVTGIVTTAATPTVEEMQAFDAVLVFTNSTPQNNVLLGDNLAAYVDSGGGVVLTIFGIRASVATRTYEGRFLSDNYYCVERSVGATTTGNATLGTVHAPGHPLMENVFSFNGGTSSFRSPAGLHPSAARVADWSTGQVLVAERTDLMGGRVDLNFFAVSQSASAASWLLTTDGAVMLRNAVVVASRCGTGPCRSDFNGDGVVDADDLGDYINCYFAVPPCDGADFNGDSEVNADDLGDFINTYFGPAC